MDPEFSITEIDDQITFAQNSLSQLHRSHSEYIIGVHTLMMLRFERYELSHQKGDLDKSIVHCTEAIFLPSIFQDGHLLKKIAALLFFLASALLERSKEFKQPEDVKPSIESLRYLRGLPIDTFDAPRNVITVLLIRALGFQVESEAEDGTQSIKEMVVLCRKLLASEISTVDFGAAFPPLDDAVHAEVKRGRSVQSLDEVTECLRDAVKICPAGSSSHQVSHALANTLCTRFKETQSNDDYEEAMTLFERILDPDQPGECPESIRVLAPLLATQLAFSRSLIFQNPEYSEVTTTRLRSLLNSSFVDERLRLEITAILAIQARDRFRRYILAESLEEVNSYTSQVVDLLSSQSLEKIGELFPVPRAVRKSYSLMGIAERIQNLEEQLPNTPPGTPQYKRLLRPLSDLYKTKFFRTNDISDIEESIKYSRLRLKETPSSDSQKAVSLTSLYPILLLAFKKTGNISYLDETITVGYDILDLKNEQYLHFLAIKRLVASLLTRSRLLGRREDRFEAIRLIPLGVDNQYVQELDRFKLSCQWARFARCIRHPTTLTAYKSAMSLMQKSVSTAPTVSIQHARLVVIGEDCQSMPLDYASYQIYLGRLEEAIETLEQGRALLWSEMRGLRTPMDQLIEDDPQLAKRFAKINQELEAMTISITPSESSGMEVIQGGDGTDPFGRLVVKRQKLMEERDELILQIQSRPGLDGFLKTPSFATLRSAALRGPVITINHCKRRSDILIIFHNSLPCSIPTANDFYDRSNKLRDELVNARKHGLDSDEYQDALASVLKGLYEIVGKPVIERLQVLGVPEQSRIWWCPTSVFCSLPLHAMGPIPSSDTFERYFSDLYIPSYTPSLSALIASRKTGPQILDKPSLLLVAQPEDSLPGVNGEIKVIQRALKSHVAVTGLVSSEATPTSVVEGLRSSQFAHFACHGVLETGKPFEASFKLHGGSHLTLLDIVRSRLPDAEFALLSCCHTAEITKDSVADEGLHLTAAMQYCGFRSVVGTMWEMADTDGRDLAKSFYKSLFSVQEASVMYYERSAGALRDATQKLREKRGITLERWVNFVHYGA